MGHSTQVVSVLARAADSVLSVPLDMKIHEGCVFEDADDEEPKHTLLDKLLTMIRALEIGQGYYLVADAYYGSGKLIKDVLADGNHLITRAKSNTVAYWRPAVPSKPRRGRPRIYGPKQRIADLVGCPGAFETMPSPVYGEKGVDIRVQTKDLLWKPSGLLTRFVIVLHPRRGRLVLLCTDTTLDAAEIVRLYGLRFKIEFMFKQAAHVIGGYDYHFWMREMRRTGRGEGDRLMAGESKAYRAAVRRKLQAYHVFLFMGVVAQGLMHYLAACHAEAVWASFGSWMRTVRDRVAPSEFVVKTALRNTLPEFLLADAGTSALAKFIVEHQGREPAVAWPIAA